MKKCKVNLKLSKMKEQDLREKLFQSFYKELKEDAGFYDEETAKVCVQIAKDYAEKEAIEFAEWIENNCTSIIGDGKYKGKRMLLSELEYYTTSELYQLFKNRENER